MPRDTKPADHSRAARNAALDRDKPAQYAIVLAMLAMMAATAGWAVVLLPAGGSVRGNPLFWLLATPLTAWVWGLRSMSAWVINTVWLVLAAAPCLSVLALFTASWLRDGQVLAAGGRLDTAGAMLVIVGLTVLLAGGGAVALRRSSLPGGGRPATYVAPGERPRDRQPLPAELIGALQLGSLGMSATMINGVAFGIVATMDAMPEEAGSGPVFGPLWPALVAAIMVLVVGTLCVRGSFRAGRRRAEAVDDLRRAWQLGALCPALLLLGLWVWPTMLMVKVGFSVFALPLALLAAWACRRASARLPVLAAETVRRAPGAA